MREQEENLEKRLAEAEEAYADAAAILGAVREPLIILNEHLRVVSANRAFYETFHVFPAEAVGRPLAALGKGQWNAPHLLDALRELLASGKAVERLEMEYDFENLGRRTIRLNARLVQRPNVRLLLAMEDVTAEKAALQDLEESERFFHALAAGLTEATLLVDDAGRLIYAGGDTYGVFGMSSEEILALGHVERLLGADLVAPAVLATQGEIQNIEWEGMTPDGWRRTLLVSMKRVALERGGFLYVCQDYAAIKARERTLRDALAELSAIYAYAPVAIMRVDRDRRVIQANRLAARLAGRSPEETIGLRSGEVLRCLHRFDDPQGCGFGPACAQCQARLAVQRTFADHQSRENVKAWLPVQHGEDIEERCYLLSTAYLELGEQESVLVCALDVTESERAERAIAESQRRFREIFERVNTGIAIYEVVGDGEDFIFKAINPAGIRIGNLPEEAHLGRSVLEVYPGVREMSLFDVFRQVWRTGIPQEHPLTQYRDGRLSLWVQNYVCKLPSGEIMAVYEDRTALKQVQEEHEQLQRQYLQAQKMEALGQLASGVAHDFNNLLTVILGYGEGLLQTVPEDDPLREDIEEIVASARRASEMTRRLLIFSRRQPIQPRLMDLNQVVRDLEKMLRRLIREDIALELVLSAEPLMVMADPGALEQVIMNLAINARDAMPEGGRLLIETAKVSLDEAYARRYSGMEPGAYALLSVTDTGIGMDEETLTHIFEPFFTTKGEGQGTGLGLATVYGIVRQCGGHIHVYSEPGLGTTFKVYLPQAHGALKEEQKEPPQAAQLEPGHERILLVEDEEVVGKLAETILERQGYRVRRASNAEEALALVDEGFKPDLVITDVVMPGMKGSALVECLRERFPGLKALYMSGYTENAIVHNGILDPNTPFIQKPFTIQGLVNRVREILKG